MQVYEVALLGVALAMDAFAVGLSDGMAEPKMRLGKMLSIAATFALFQFAMPLVGYFCSRAFSSLVEKIAPWLSFALLSCIGIKAIADAKTEGRAGEIPQKSILGVGKLCMQGVATSMDALAVGVTFLAVETGEGLPFPVSVCALVIGLITFLLSLPAVLLGKKTGDALKGKAEVFGGVILIAIGIKILLEGLL